MKKWVVIIPKEQVAVFLNSGFWDFEIKCVTREYTVDLKQSLKNLKKVSSILTQSPQGTGVLKITKVMITLIEILASDV